MKRIITMIALLLLVIFNTGCERPPYVFLTGLYDPYGILGTNMPYTDKLNDLQFDNVYKIEEDSYGRRYYIYTTYSGMWMSELEIHVISQKSNSRLVYYYEDLCYRVKDPTSESLDVREIETFKAQNDWNCVLDEAKMHPTERKELHEDIVDEMELEKKVLAYFELPKDGVVVSEGMEIYDDSKQIFYVRVAKNSEEYKKQACCYMILYSTEEGGTIIYSEEFPLIADCNQSVIAFREKCMEIINETE